MKSLIRSSLMALAALCLPTVLCAEEFDPAAYRQQVDTPTRVMVLGTAHLGNADAGWNPAVLDLLLDRLAAFAPDIITIENQPGPTTHKLWAYRAVMPETAATYAGRAMAMATSAGLSLDMDMPQAEAALRQTLARLSDRPAPAERRRLAALFAGAGDPYSALVQWWHLPPAERVAGDGISRSLAAQLDELGQENEEGVLLAVRLAVRLGLERVHQTDSQEDDVFTPEEAEIFAQQVFPLLAEAVSADPLVQQRGRLADMTTPEAALEAYRRLNDERIERRLAELEWLGAINRPTQANVGRKRMAAWEARNLRMAANIRESAARAPGGKVLVIVGATHKLWLEAYLGMMSDIAIISTDSVLQ